MWLHPKIRDLKSANSIALWTVCASFCGDKMTDGNITTQDLRTVAASTGIKTVQRYADDLVQVGLWDVTENGYRFHDWNQWNEPTEKIRKKADAHRERMDKYRHKDTNSTNSDASRDGPVTQHNPNSDASRDASRDGPVTPLPEPEPEYTVTLTRYGETPTAQTLIAEWIDHCQHRPPNRVIGQIAKELNTLIAEEIPYDAIRQGLAAWHAKGLHPSTLASVVNETMNRSTTGAYRAGSQPSVETRRLLDAQHLIDLYDSEDTQTPELEA